MSQSPDIGQNSNGGISDFRISVQSFINENCHNSEAGNYIGMKLDQVTEPEKRNKATLKKLEDEVMSASCGVIVIFPIYGNLEHFGIRIPDA